MDSQKYVMNKKSGSSVPQKPRKRDRLGETERHSEVEWCRARAQEGVWRGTCGEGSPPAERWHIPLAGGRSFSGVRTQH